MNGTGFEFIFSLVIGENLQLSCHFSFNIPQKSPLQDQIWRIMPFTTVFELKEQFRWYMAKLSQLLQESLLQNSRILIRRYHKNVSGCWNSCPLRQFASTNVQFHRNSPKLFHLTSYILLQKFPGPNLSALLRCQWFQKSTVRNSFQVSYKLTPHLRGHHIDK